MDYLGSVALSKHSSDLMSLQEPLKDLYLRYLSASSRQEASLPGTVEISKTGLKVRIYKKSINRHYYAY